MTTPDRRPQFDWDRQHSAFTPEGQIESARAFGRGLERKGFQRFLLALIALFVLFGILGLLS